MQEISPTKQSEASTLTVHRAGNQWTEGNFVTEFGCNTIQRSLPVIQQKKIEYEIRRNDKILSIQGEAETGHDDDNDVEGELN